MKKTIKYQWKRLCFLFAALVIGLQAWAQVSISGTVVDEQGQTLPGVAVVLKGTVSGTVTNVDGIYTITAPADGTLEFSFVGMQTVVEPINQRTTVNVTMKMDAIGLEEVVAVGYGVQKKATLTGSVGNVKAEELLQRPVANTTELLQGQVAGLVTRQASGLPGSDGTILNIRGFGDNPLVLIDGIEGDLSQIDPNDVESLSVLKDAAAAVYGARAGNGVILVTTKRGQVKRSQITYHGSVSLTRPTFLPDLVEAREWAELISESGLNPDNFSPKHLHYDPETKRLINTLDNSDFAGYDWNEALYKNWAPQQQHNVSATGGSDKIKYFISAGFTDQESAFKSGDYDFNRYNVRSNIDAEITNYLGISLDLSYRNTILDKANFSEDNMYNSLLTAKPVYPIVHEADPGRAATSGFLQRSPYYQTIKEFTGNQEYRDYAIQGALEIRYSFPMLKGSHRKSQIKL
jgi:TonB-linked SusC/RagA family outer membrane protein